MNFKEFHRRSIEDRDGFWAEQAALIDWHKPFDTVCDYSRPPFVNWFAGGQTNLCHNAVDRHLAARPDANALIWVSTEVDQEVIYSFRQLHAEVQRMAACLIELGVKKGDRVLIYMPMIAEAAFAMLACARIGAIHSVVFGGFASVSLASRIDNATPVVIVSADAGSRSGKVVPYKGLLDEAIQLAAAQAAEVLMVDRGLAPFVPVAGRDADYATLRQKHIDAQVPCEWVDATHPSYTLYTSGTTGTPKGVQRDTGGYCVALAASMKHIFLRPAGRDLLLHQRHRLGGGPQLHRLWPADRRHGDDHVRRPAHPARCRRLVEPGREVQGDRDVQRTDRGACAEEAGPGVPEEVRPVLAARAVPGRRAAGRADGASGSPTAWASPDHRQLLADRDRLADPDHLPTASRRRRASSARRACRSYGYDVKLVDESTGEEVRSADEKGVVMIEGPLPPGCMQTVWQDDARFVKTYWSTVGGKQAVQHLRLGRPRRRRLLLHPRPHRRCHQRRRPPPGHARDRGEHLQPPQRGRGGGGGRGRSASRARWRWPSSSPRTPAR